ncbi:MAG: bifunctional glutamate N-acetyltransferase/amino-acid acetyltransferase ArgJ [Robiginitomaculum sp.]|nr:bifunctional glutamate N-acetyltransferase/amino-acid acetyltransferase ArgJ [Robiginitomaculum sp.]
MHLKRSPLAPSHFPDMPHIGGVQMWTAKTGAKYQGRPDVLLVKLAGESRVASVFTKSTAPGAPVEWSKACLARGANAGLLVNAGNANVFTGQIGRDGVRDMANMAAGKIGCEAQDVYVASTGVIGEPLILSPIEQGVKGIQVADVNCSWEDAARAISTTDTYPKGSAQSCTLDGAPVHICGIAKGSGMIAPDMATMLSFIFTDANISRAVLQVLLSELNETSFNAITVDSDTSTSDTVLLAATAQASHGEINDINDPELVSFKRALGLVMHDLAHQVVKDGEGASKFVEICVTGAESGSAAKAIAMSIANSPLVKTAIAGEDANWGRIVMAVGKSGAHANRDKLAIYFGPHLVAKDGYRAPEYDEDRLAGYMKNSELKIRVDVAVGTESFTVWTCDLTHGYIDINADYRS